MPINRVMLVFVLICNSSLAQAEKSSMGPVIADYGPVYAIDYRDVPLRKDMVYRAVFDVVDKADEPAALNQKLTSVARFLNMHVRNGIAPENIELAVVIHGRAMHAALSDEAHRKRYGAENPNQDLLTQLHAAGVKFYICGQSMEFARFDRAELAAPIKVALSAMSMLTQLQADGYALLP